METFHGCGGGWEGSFDKLGMMGLQEKNKTTTIKKTTSKGDYNKKLQEPSKIPKNSRNKTKKLYKKENVTIVKLLVSTTT